MSPGNGGSGHVCSHQLPAAIFEENSVKGTHSLGMFVYNEHLSMNEVRGNKYYLRHIPRDGDQCIENKDKKDRVYNSRILNYLPALEEQLMIYGNCTRCFQSTIDIQKAKATEP